MKHYTQVKNRKEKFIVKSRCIVGREKKRKRTCHFLMLIANFIEIEHANLTW